MMSVELPSEAENEESDLISEAAGRTPSAVLAAFARPGKRFDMLGWILLEDTGNPVAYGRRPSFRQTLEAWLLLEHGCVWFQAQLEKKTLGTAVNGFATGRSPSDLKSLSDAVKDAVKVSFSPMAGASAGEKKNLADAGGGC